MKTKIKKNNPTKTKIADLIERLRDFMKDEPSTNDYHNEVLDTIDELRRISKNA